MEKTSPGLSNRLTGIEKTTEKERDLILNVFRITQNSIKLYLTSNSKIFFSAIMR